MDVLPGLGHLGIRKWVQRVVLDHLDLKPTWRGVLSLLGSAPLALLLLSAGVVILTAKDFFNKEWPSISL